MTKVLIEIYGQYIKISSDNLPKLIVTFLPFLNKLMIWGVDKKYNKKFRKMTFKRKLEKFFYIEEHAMPGLTKSKDCLRIPRTLEKELINYIMAKKNIITEDILDIVYKKPIEGIVKDIEFRKDITLRDYQEEYVNAISTTDKNNILVDLYTGYGKTMIAVNAIVRKRKKFCIAILPTYIPKWVDDITSLTNIKKEEILILKGSSSIYKLLESNNKDLEKYKCFILSIPTFHAFVQSYLTGELSLYGNYSPDMIFDKMGIEVLLNDEGHQHFHQVVELSLFANVKLMLILTATLITDNRSLNRIYDLVIPEEQRINNIVKYRPYMHAIGITYNFKNPKVIKYKTNRGYNQVKLEQSILKRSDITKNYCDMIDSAVVDYYLKKKKKDSEKVLIYAGTIKMCEVIRDYLKDKHKDLKITKYTEEDPYEAILNNQVIISTIQSAGVALDIPDLITVLQTVNINSPAANEQSRGRLRKLKDNDTWFVFFWSLDIPQHKIYTRNRINLFRGKVKELLHKKYTNRI